MFYSHVVENKVTKELKVKEFNKNDNDIKEVPEAEDAVVSTNKNMNLIST